MRVTARPLNALQPRFSPPTASPSRTRATREAVDSFTPAPTTKKVVADAAKQALGAVAETAFTAVLSKVLDVIATRLASLLDGLLARLGGGAKPAPAAPPAAPAEPGVTAPVQPAAPQGPAAPAGLAPTPLAKEVPNQVGYVNTIQEPRIAPKSAFRDVVNQAIDAVRAKHVGIDPQDPDRITDYDAYHHGVVMELRARGYNAAYDGEELAVGRPNDSFSEQFDISTSTGLVRRFYAAWMSPPVWG